MAGAKKLEAKLQISGEVEASLKKAMEAAEKNMETFKTAAKAAEGATGALTQRIKDQEKQLKAAQKMYASYALAGDTASDEARNLAAAIDDLSWDLANNKTALANAEDAARGLASRYDSVENDARSAGTGIRDANEAAGQADGGFTVLKGTVASLAADGFQALISGAKQSVTALLELSAQTEQFRSYMASLDTAYSQANFSANQAYGTMRELYATIGDEDQATEAANNVARVSQSQQDLTKWLQISKGTWGIYEKALPIENLAEAAGETARTGTVTGGLADALNWSSEAAAMFSDYMGGDVVTAEDAFNKALSECSTEQERQALIMDTLYKLYGDAGTAYEQANAGLMDYRRSTLDATKAQASLADIMDPVNTKVNELKSSLMERLAPALETVADKAVEMLTWLQEHPGVMQAIITAAGVLAGVLTVVAIAMVVVGAASAIASAGMLPIIGVAALVAAAIGAIIFAVLNLGNIWDWLKGKASELAVWLSSLWEAIKTAVANAVTAVVTFIQTGWSGLTSIVSEIWNGIKDTISGIWDSIKKLAGDFAQGVVDKISGIWNGLTDILTAPFDALSGIIDGLSSKIGSFASKVKSKLSSITSSLPHFASGGFTAGPSIAGEAGPEAVISFDPAYRAQNLRYWATAGQMLGVDDVSPLMLSTNRMLPDNESVSPLALTSGNTTNSTTTVIESVNFAPNITINGNAEKQDIIAAIRETYPEFMDLIDEVLADREVGAYAI